MTKGKGFVTSIANTMAQVKSELQKEPIKDDGHEKVIKIDPNLISNWEFRDRQFFELGDINELAVSIETKGQAQPIIVVYADEVFKSGDSTQCKYVVIAGYRRWLACRSRNITVDVIIRKMTFEQAIACLVSENEKEKVSDYSKGMFYYKLLNQEKITKKSLYEKLGLKKGVFDNYLSFSEVPTEVWDAVGDLTNVSARTSSTIKLLVQKGDKYRQALISIGKKISEGIGEKRIISLVNIELNKGTNNIEIQNATRVAFSDSIQMEYKKNQIRLFLKDISNEKLELLQMKISDVLENFVRDFN